ncbi:MAG: viroplasmin family protein [Solirubrobacterales bacterium]
MQKKYYAVKEGFDFKDNKQVRDIILNSWDECLKYVKGVKGAKYKSFKTMEEAQNYISGTIENLSAKDEYPKDCLHIYVDGSYSNVTEKYSYAFVAVKDDVIVHVESGASKDNAQKKLRQIAGELEAALRAVAYAFGEGEKKVAIIHDYAGIYHHASGTWERKDSSSAEYYDKMNKFLDRGIDVIFIKAKGHSGDIFNELADSFAKAAIEIPLTKAVDNYLKDNNIFVKNCGLMEKVKSVVKSTNVMNIKITSRE